MAINLCLLHIIRIRRKFYDLPFYAVHNYLLTTINSVHKMFLYSAKFLQKEIAAAHHRTLAQIFVEVSRMIYLCVISISFCADVVNEKLLNYSLVSSFIL